MNFEIPVDIIRNNGYGLTSLDFVVYCVLLRSCKSLKMSKVNIDVHLLKKYTDINDNRTIKKILRSLMENVLLKDKDIKLNRNGKFTIDILDLNVVKTNCYIMTDDTLELIKKVSPNAFRIYLLYNTYDTIRKPTYNDIAKLYKMSPNTIVEVNKELVNLNLINNSEHKDIIGNYVGIDELVYFNTDDIEPTFKKFTEKKLENILIKCMDAIEHGMKLIDNQFEIGDGKIDILARDKNNVLCIIELKVEDDNKDLIYQCAYYPTQFKEKTRMISICPSYSERIKSALNGLGYVEMKTYKMDEENVVVENYIN